jgi:nitrous oxidase accessory protein
MIALPLVLLFQAAPPAARTVTIPAAGAVSVQAALDAAVPGDTVRLASGVHPGPIVIRKRVTLIGLPGAVIDGGRRGTVVTVRADSVTIENLVIMGSGHSLDRDEAAIKLDECTGCRVIGNIIREPLHGIYLLRSQSITIERNEITGSSRLEEPHRGNGIHLFSSGGNRLEGNRIRGTRDGIYFSFASGNRVVDNDVAEVRYGLHYMYSDDNVFERNRFTRNAAGAAIMFSKRITFRETTFSRHVGYRAYGILLQTGEDIVAERNRIEGNLTGLFLDGAVRNVFRENIVSGNGVGIDLLASAEDNLFTRNLIADNRIPVRKVLGAGRNRWDDGHAGNYWDDAAVFDLDGDGIGERPYRVGDTWTSLAAARPSLELFNGTLAARALGWAEEAFPVFDVPRVEDELPLAAAPREASAEASRPGGTHPIRQAALLLALLVTYGGSAGLLGRRAGRRTA